MTNEEFRKYYNEQKLQGRSESQIARSLGMSLSHFIGRLNGVDVDKVDPPKKEKKPKKEVKVDIPPVVVEEPKEELKEEPKPAEDLSWMDD